MPEKSADLVEGLIVKPGTNGRRTYSVAAKRALVQLCNRPGTSVAGLALAHGVNANLLRRWMVQYSPRPAASAPEKGSPALLPVTTGVSTVARPSASTDSCIEITFMGVAIRLRGVVDARALNIVLDCLAQRA